MGGAIGHISRKAPFTVIATEETHLLNKPRKTRIMKPLRAGMLVYCLLYSWSMGQEDPDLESSFSGFPENYTKMLLEHLNNVVGLDSDNVHTKSESTVIPQFL